MVIIGPVGRGGGAFEFYKIVVQLPIFFLHNNDVARTSYYLSTESFGDFGFWSAIISLL